MAFPLSEGRRPILGEARSCVGPGCGRVGGTGVLKGGPRAGFTDSHFRPTAQRPCLLRALAPKPETGLEPVTPVDKLERGFAAAR